jgi:hypothetical protein
MAGKVHALKLKPGGEWFDRSGSQCVMGDGIARVLGLKIGETPVHFRANDTRGSFVKPAAIVEFAANLLRYRFSRKERTSRENPRR